MPILCNSWTNSLWAVLIALVFVGCGDPVTESLKPNTGNEIPVRGGTVVARIMSDPGTMNRLMANNGTISEIETYIFPYLSQLDPIAMEIRPHLAIAAPTMSADSLHFTYEIREEARWADGKPVLAEDVLFTYKMMMLSGIVLPNFYDYYSSFLKNIELDTQNPRKLTFEVGHLLQDADAMLGGISIYPRHLWDPDNLLGNVTLLEILQNLESTLKLPSVKAFGELVQSDAYRNSPTIMQGSGPYKLKAYEAGIKIELERVNDWWGDQVNADDWFWKAYPDRIIFRPIEDPTAAVAEIKAGNLDVCLGLPTLEYIQLTEDQGPVSQQYNFKLQSRLAINLLAMNMRPTASNRTPFFDDIKVRKALNLLLDKATMLETVYEGQAEMLDGPLPKSLGDVSNPNLPASEFNIEKAKKLLDEAGWIDSNQDGIRDKILNGKKVEFKPEILHSEKSSTAGKIVALLHANCLQAGIDLQIKPLEFKRLSELTRDHNYDIAFTGATIPPVLPDFKENYHSLSWQGGGNISGVADAELDDLILKARSESNRAARVSLLHKTQEKLVGLQPCIWVSCPMEKIVASKKWNGLTTFSSHPFIMLNTLWMPQVTEKQTGEHP